MGSPIGGLPIVMLEGVISVSYLNTSADFTCASAR
jgi:hypothetical protein